MEPSLARKTWRTVEPVHAMVYFTPEAQEEYERLGLRGSRMGYFASRSAAFGPVAAEVVIATFYNFEPGLVRAAIPAAWSLVTPVDLVAGRTRAAVAALRRGLGEEVAGSSAVLESAHLARRAADAARERPQGRPLFAAHAALEWPDDPLAELWFAQTLLREFRGDGHIAALLLADLDPVEALVTHEASGELPAGVLQASRAWSDDAWSEGVERLRRRGLVSPENPLSLTEPGKELRRRVEDETDARAVLAYAALGPEGCERLRTLARPISKAVVASGLLPSAIGRIPD